eukprot:scaffold6806_cov74-Cylindrotheca_fusiformis.AAC.1
MLECVLQDQSASQFTLFRVTSKMENFGGQIRLRISFEGVSRGATCAVVGDKMTIFLRSAGGLFCRLNTDVSVRLKSGYAAEEILTSSNRKNFVWFWWLCEAVIDVLITMTIA